MYGAETWTMNARMQKRLDGCYTNLLRKAQNMSWKNHHTLEEIYGSVPKISGQLAERRARFAGHCFRAKDEMISDLILWNPSSSRKLTFPDVISRDTGIRVNELSTAIPPTGEK